MQLEPEHLLQRAIESGALDAQKGNAALAVYTKLQGMGAEFSFGDFLIERGLLARMAVEAFEADTDETFEAVDTLGDFQLIELIGEGENGAVFRAHQKSLERDVAVKILNTEIAQDEAAVERFLREARAVAKLNHPNVVHGYSAGSEHGLHYFAMELLEGGSASALLEAAGGRLSERRALEIVAQAAEGLKAAHAHNILHRDVKPDNILLSVEGVAKLTDLGIAQVVHATADGGTFWGSPPYVAPETVSGSAINDPRSDIYSLGATLFELLIGSPPFLADDPAEILRMHLTEEPHDVKQLRPELSVKTATLVKLMLAKDPNDRALSADVVSKAIARILLDLEAAKSSGTHASVTTAPAVRRPIHPPAGGPHRSPVRLAPNAKKLPLKKPVPRPPLQAGQRPVSGHALPARHPIAARPATPVRPGVPARSNVPARPAVPMRPAVPARPAVPMRPANPARSNVPVRPNPPAHPRAPNAPPTSVRPAVPARPGIPDRNKRPK